MWGALLKIFKPSTLGIATSSSCEENEEEKLSDESAMNEKLEDKIKLDVVGPGVRSQDVYHVQADKAKQRASILWLTAKANNNKVPDDLKEPHYKDHDDQDQLKPVIVHALASAEYYCLALGNIYADPNYHQLNHWGVIQALARKGIYVAEPSDVALTETVLIQTSPIRMSAHMAVIEGIMSLYIKETVTTDRIVQAVKRFTSYSPSNELPSDTEDALVLWINKACVKMKHRIEEEMNANDPELQNIPETKEEESSAKSDPSAEVVDGKEALGNKENAATEDKKAANEDKKAANESSANDSNKSSSDPTPAASEKKSGEFQDRVPPSISVLQDLSDLSDGCCLATLISFYCPTALKWREICYNSPMSMADSLYNLHLVQKFCRDHLPANPCFLSLEDLVYQHSSVRQNILAFVADLFFLLEIKPVKCVQMPGIKPDPDNLEAQNGRGFLPVVSAAGKRSSQQAVSPIPDLRTNNFNSMPDINRISPRSHTSPSQPVKEPMFPRRQVVTQPECRTLDRAKRYSFHEASRGAYSGGTARTPGSEEPVGSIRRTHSLLDIHRSAMEKGYSDTRPKTKEFHRKNSNGETRVPGEAESEPEVYYVHRSRGFTPPSSSKVPDNGSRPSSGYDELDDAYARSPRKIEERLLPARLRPSKERNNSDSKMDERGEGERRSGHPSSGPSPVGHVLTRPKFPRRSSVDDSRTRHSSGMEGDPLSGGQYSLHDVPKHSTKNDIPQGQVGDSFIFPEKYSLESAKAAGIPVVRDDDYNINYEGYHDNRELEERLAAQNYEKTTLYVPGGDAHKTQYIIIAPGEKGKEEALMHAGEKQPIHTTSFAQLSKLREHQGGGINIVYMQHDRDHNFDNNRHPLKSSFLQKKGGAEKKTTTFAATPNTTTWQHQGAASSVMSPGVDSGHETPSDGGNDPPLATQLHNVRLKLEEKRRRIEVEKRRMELTLNRARQKLGKAAFLQAVTKGKGSGRNTPDSGASGDLGSPTAGRVDVTIPEESQRAALGQDKGYTMEEIADNLAVVQNKWLESQMSVDTLSSTDSDRPSPDVDGVTFEEYTRSLDRLNTNLTDLQTDIHRLTQQQDHIQRMVQNGIPQPQQPQPQIQQQDRPFYVSELQQWAPQQHRLPTEQDYAAMARQQQVSPAHRRSQWGPASTVISVGPDVHMPVNSMVQQRLSGPPSSPYTYVDQHGYLVRQAPDGYAVHQQHGGVNLSSQNGPNPDQYVTYNQYGIPQHGSGQSPYHPPMPPAADVYTRYTPPQVPSAPAPFRLHVEGPPLSAQQSQRTTPPPQQQQQQQQQQQPQVVYQQKPVVSQSSPVPRPTSIHSSRPGKQFSVRAPPESVMEPQSVHFIEDTRDNGVVEELAKTLSSLESVSGTATYRVRESTSPTRPLLSRTFRVPKPKTTPPSPSQEEKVSLSGDEDFEDDGMDPQGRKSAGSDKGFFVSFDDQPKRNKPPLRTKKVPRVTHRGEGGEMDSEPVGTYTPVRSASLDRSVSAQRNVDASPEFHGQHQDHDHIIKVNVEGSGELSDAPQKGESPAVGFVIKEGSVDPADEEELARKRERILLNAVKRKEEQEAMRAQKEMEAAQRREQDRIKQEMLDRKREEERARRQAIFEQYKQRKALEDSEQNERIETPKTSTLPKTKQRHPKQRPKSLHESAMPSSETRSSNSNLASVGGSRGSRGSQLNLAGAGSDSGSSMSFRYGDTDSGLGRSTPPRRAQSPGHATYRHPLSPSTGPPSLPPGLVARRGGPISDTASDTCSTTSSTLEYTGPKLFKQPTAKSNRGIVINAINSVLAGAVNQDSKKRALEEIAQSDSKHFLILFRDSGCQFRALYSYYPDKEEVFKLFGTGPKQVHEHMIDRYYKYNSGGKSFMEIQTKHLTVTIDAFTIHNSLWQGKKGLLPKKDLL